jgi:hypothetical protein
MFGWVKPDQERFGVGSSLESQALEGRKSLAIGGLGMKAILAIVSE